MKVVESVIFPVLLHLVVLTLLSKTHLSFSFLTNMSDDSPPIATTVHENVTAPDLDIARKVWEKTT